MTIILIKEYVGPQIQSHKKKSVPKETILSLHLHSIAANNPTE